MAPVRLISTELLMPRSLTPSILPLPPLKQKQQDRIQSQGRWYWWSPSLDTWISGQGADQESGMSTAFTCTRVKWGWCRISLKTAEAASALNQGETEVWFSKQMKSLSLFFFFWKKKNNYKYAVCTIWKGPLHKIQNVFPPAPLSRVT